MLIRKIAITAMLSFAALSSVYARTPAEGLDNLTEIFLKNMRYKLEALMPSRARTATTAVGGVRGSQVDAGDMYWKGDVQGSEQQALELSEALQDIQDGNADSARSRIQKFLRDHPDSPLKADATEALALISNP